MDVVVRGSREAFPFTYLCGGLATILPSILLNFFLNKAEGGPGERGKIIDRWWDDGKRPLAVDVGGGGGGRETFFIPHLCGGLAAILPSILLNLFLKRTEGGSGGERGKIVPRWWDLRVCRFDRLFTVFSAPRRGN